MLGESPGRWPGDAAPGVGSGGLEWVIGRKGLV